jgi:hypothetical protein
VIEFKTIVYIVEAALIAALFGCPTVGLFLCWRDHVKRGRTT